MKNYSNQSQNTNLNLHDNEQQPKIIFKQNSKYGTLFCVAMQRSGKHSKFLLKYHSKSKK